MTRKIKFRAWDSYYERFIYESGAGGQVEIDNILNLSEVATEMNWCVEQFTGLVDKNCKEIYEGDILKIVEKDTDDFGPDEIFVCEVCFGGGEYPSSFTTKNSHFYKGFAILDSRFNGDKEVIGNIYENPELLK